MVKCNSYKENLAAAPKEIAIDNIDNNTKYNLIVETSTNYKIPCYFSPPILPTSDEVFTSHELDLFDNKLIVFLSAVGIYRGENTIFHRISWSEHINQACLYIDDPGRLTSKFAPSYFIGTENSYLIDDIIKLILKFANIYKIKNNNIIFVSSSNGGFASLKLANLIPTSICFSFCPQFSIPIYLNNRYTFFKQKFIDNKSKLRHCPELNLEIFDDNSSYYYIFSNLASSVDFAQIQFLQEKLSVNLNNKIVKINNVKLITYTVDTKNINPHMVQPGEFEFISLLYSNNLLNISNVMLESLCNHIKHFWLLQDRLKDNS